MIRSLRHWQLVRCTIERNSRPRCRCLSTGGDGKQGADEEMGIQAKEDNGLDTTSKPSLSAKLAKPVGRLQHEKDPRYRMPGLAPGQMDMSEVSQNIDDRLLKLAKSVARSLAKDPKQAKRTESELEFMLKSTAVERESAKDGEPVLVDMMKILKGFDIERPIPKREMKPERFVQRLRDDQQGRGNMEEVAEYDRWQGSVSQSIIQGAARDRPRRGDRQRNVIEDPATGRRYEDRRPMAGGLGRPKSAVTDIYSFEPFGIFDDRIKAEDQRSLCPTWERLAEDELNMATTLPPQNAFEEMILWTKQGKVWKYPIDNEQGQ